MPDLQGDLNGVLSALLTAQADDWPVHGQLLKVDRAQDGTLFNVNIRQKNMVLSPLLTLDVVQIAHCHWMDDRGFITFITQS